MIKFNIKKLHPSTLGGLGENLEWRLHLQNKKYIKADGI